MSDIIVGIQISTLGEKDLSHTLKKKFPLNKRERRWITVAPFY